MVAMDSYLGWKVDFAAPAGAPAFSARTRCTGASTRTPSRSGVGGVAAVLLEFADARIRSGVWDHSTYKADPIGRSRRTGMAAMVGVYGPQDAARRVIQGVTNMHARVSRRHARRGRLSRAGPRTARLGERDGGLRLPDGLRPFCSPGQRGRQAAILCGKHAGGAALWRAALAARPTRRLHGDDGTSCAALRTAPDRARIPVDHREGRAAPGAPKILHRQLARASVSILPPLVREKLQLGRDYDLSPMGAAAIRFSAPSRTASPSGTPRPRRRARGWDCRRTFSTGARTAQARVLQHGRRQRGAGNRGE